MKTKPRMPRMKEMTNPTTSIPLHRRDVIFLRCDVVRRAVAGYCSQSFKCPESARSITKGFPVVPPQFPNSTNAQLNAPLDN